MALCNIVEYFKLYCPSSSDRNLCGFAGCRRRCCIVGWSQRSVWRTSQGLWSCLQWGRESPALPATPATTTATTPPVCPAHLEPTQMAPTVNLHTPGMHCYQGVFRAFQSVFISEKSTKSLVLFYFFRLTHTNWCPEDTLIPHE